MKRLCGVSGCVMTMLNVEMTRREEEFPPNQEQHLLDYYVIFENSTYANAALWWFTRVEKQPRLQGYPFQIRHSKWWALRTNGHPCETIIIRKVPSGISEEDIRSVMGKFVDVVDVRFCKSNSYDIAPIPISFSHILLRFLHSILTWEQPVSLSPSTLMPTSNAPQLKTQLLYFNIISGILLNSKVNALVWSMSQIIRRNMAALKIVLPCPAVSSI